MRTFRHLGTGIIIVLAGVVAVGCARQEPAMLEEARAAYNQARNDPAITQSAPLELNRAGERLQRAEDSFKRNLDSDQVTHEAYVAKQKVAVAQETARLRLAEQQIAQADTQRKQVLLDARQREIQAARERAEAGQQELRTAQERTQAQDRELQELRERAARADELEAKVAQMRELDAQETSRGLVLTMPGVFFDFDSSQLNPGAQRSLDQLAEVLKEHSDRNVTIEGFTDSVGDPNYNERLSQERAQAVRDALVERGVNPERIQTRGYGEQYPIASNDTEAGRQMNRRVEIIIGHADERVGGIR